MNRHNAVAQLDKEAEQTREFVDEDDGVQLNMMNTSVPNTIAHEV